MKSYMMTRQSMVDVFNEWLKRYQEDPRSFNEYPTEAETEGNTYGDMCVTYFVRIWDELSDQN